IGALQPGMPAPSMLPKDWDLLIVDLKDCFFTIDLHPADTLRFAFTLPAINRKVHARFHQNANGLHRAYRITIDEARGIVRACPECAAINQEVGLGIGVNPRGLRS
ncbi:POK8 protein, partial [Leiothrix lutea]|nr:POK8 protein [Leiothrix lutea]